MAFSQVQCLDDSHVNWRSSESKPEFFYSEEQRLALEALVSRGPEAFYEVLKKENIRDFLSELELKRITETLEIYDPGSEYTSRRGSTPGDSEGDPNSQAAEQDMAPSLEYWPQRSDRSIPQLDLGWPESAAYRGVTRATVYMQPPINGQAHIKEVVRKMIFQAQKVRRSLIANLASLSRAEALALLCLPSGELRPSSRAWPTLPSPCQALHQYSPVSFCCFQAWSWGPIQVPRGAAGSFPVFPMGAGPRSLGTTWPWETGQGIKMIRVAS